MWWERGGDLGANTYGRLVCPEPGDVARRVAAAAKDEEWELEGLGVGEAFAVGADVEVKAAEAVAAEGVGTALNHNGRGVVGAHAGADDGFEELDVGEVVDAVVQGNIEGMVSSRVGVAGRARGIQAAGAGEEDGFIVFMER